MSELNKPNINIKNVVAKLFKNNINRIKKLKTECFNWMYGLSSNDFRVVMLPKSYITHPHG